MAIVEPRKSKAASSPAVSFSGDGALSASTAAVATQQCEPSCPKMFNSSKLSFEAVQLARADLSLFMGEQASASMDTDKTRALSAGSGDPLSGQPPPKDRRLFGPDDAIVDASQAVRVCPAKPEVPGVGFQAGYDKKTPDAPPTAFRNYSSAAAVSKDEITSMVVESLAKARKEIQAKVNADNQVLLQIMSDSNRRETEAAISSCVTDLTALV